MNNFRFVTQLDVFAVNAQLFKLKPADWKPVEARGETNNPMIGLGASMLLRAHAPVTKENWLHDLPVHDTRELEPWKSMQKLLAQARKAIMAESVGRQYLSGEMARAMVSRLDKGSSIFWHVDDGDYHERTVRFHLPLVTNPACIMYSGPESLHMEAGSLWFFNNKFRHSAGNWGPFMRLHLIFEMYRIDVPAENAEAKD